MAKYKKAIAAVALMVALGAGILFGAAGQQATTSGQPGQAPAIHAEGFPPPVGG